MVKIRTVTVIGATGTMGANVAGIFASFGDAKVYCIGRDMEKVKKTIPRIVKSVKADAIAKNLIPADFSALEQCVAESDLVFESSAEDMKIKTKIAERVGRLFEKRRYHVRELPVFLLPNLLNIIQKNCGGVSLAFICLIRLITCRCANLYLQYIVTEEWRMN